MSKLFVKIYDYLFTPSVEYFPTLPAGWGRAVSKVMLILFALIAVCFLCFTVLMVLRMFVH